MQVTGRQFWWAVHYPASGITTANEIHIPVGQPVRLELASEDVVHNLWVPELLGKFDLIPGKTNVTTIQADQPGVYEGLCAEYCPFDAIKMDQNFELSNSERHVTHVYSLPDLLVSSEYYARTHPEAWSAIQVFTASSARWPRPGSVTARASVYPAPLMTFWCAIPRASIHATRCDGSSICSYCDAPA